MNACDPVSSFPAKERLLRERVAWASGRAACLVSELQMKGAGWAGSAGEMAEMAVASAGITQRSVAAGGLLSLRDFTQTPMAIPHPPLFICTHPTSIYHGPTPLYPPTGGSTGSSSFYPCRTKSVSLATISTAHPHFIGRAILKWRVTLTRTLLPSIRRC